MTHKVGDGTLLDLLVYSLSNLFSAAMKLPRCVVVIASLDAAYDDVSQKIGNQLNDLKSEARRGAKSITPVDLNTDEVYAILRKRLFTRLPEAAEVQAVAGEYRRALTEATKTGALPKAAESIADEIATSYPFHPAFKDILAMFKENEKFRQTRGLIEFSANLLRGIWGRPEVEGDVLLAGVQEVDFADLATRDQVKDIERTLESALSTDIYDNDGSAHAQAIDRERGDRVASMLCGMLFISSLSDSADGVKGLAKAQLSQYLIRPGLGITKVDEAFDTLRERCWYLHSRGDDKWYFSDTANLKKRLAQKAAEAPAETVFQEIKRRIEAVFKPHTGEAYAKVIALPQIAEINLSANQRLCLVLSPDNKTPPATAERLFNEQTYKNAFCVIASDGSRMPTLEDNARRLWAIGKLKHEVSANPRYAVELTHEEEVAEMAFFSNMTSTFNKLWFPTGRNGNGTLKPTTLDLGSPRAREKQGAIRGESAVIDALADIGVRKLIRFVDDQGKPRPDSETHQEIEKLIVRAEDKLFPEGQSRMRWKDLVDRAAARADWPWLGPKKLEEVRNTAVAKERWTYDDEGYVDYRPPAPKPVITLALLNFDRQTGLSEIEIATGNVGQTAQVYVSTSPDPLQTGEVVSAGRFMTREVELWFAVTDPATGDSSEAVRWQGELTLTHDVQTVGDEHHITLQVTPDAEIRWNAEGTNDKEGAIYTGEAIVVGASQRTTLYAYAVKGGVETRKTFVIDAVGTEKTIAPDKPARLEKKSAFNTRREVYALIDGAVNNQGVELLGARLRIGENASAVTINFGSSIRITGEKIRACLESMKGMLGDENPSVDLVVNTMLFDSGYTLKSFATAAGLSITPDDIHQDA